MSDLITDADLAELYEALNLPGAAHFRATADASALDAEEPQRELDALLDELDNIPEPAASTKHSETCWQRHARCLADRLLEGGNPW